MKVRNVNLGEIVAKSHGSASGALPRRSVSNFIDLSQSTLF